MQIQINTDASIEGREKLAAYVTGIVESALSHFRERITRVEVHLSDQSSHKGHLEDVRCMMEVRLENHPPAAVTDQAAALDKAVEGAAKKLKNLLESMLGRLDDHRSGLTS